MNLIVSSLFCLLVIIYHGIIVSYLEFASFRFSAKISNKYFPFPYTSNLNVPLGPECPNLVPWPPAIVTTAYSPFRITSSPNDSNSSFSFLDNLLLSM